MGTVQASGKEPMSPSDQEAAFVLPLLKERDAWLDRFRPDGLCDFSVLVAPLDAEREQAQRALEHRSGNVEDRCLGAMLGLAIGDALGAPMEFSTLRYGSTHLKDMGQEEIWKIDHTAPDRGFAKNEFGYNRFELKPGQYTDDTSMAICLADSLLVCRGFNGIDLRLRFLNWWQFGYNNAFKLDAEWRKQDRCGSVGLGGNIGASLREFQESPAAFTAAGDRFTNGNGSIMRLAPCAIFFRGDSDAALSVAEQQSKTTHQGDEAGDCSRLLAHILLGAFQGPPRAGAHAAERTPPRNSSSPARGAAPRPGSSGVAGGGAAGTSTSLARGGRAIVGSGRSGAAARASSRSRGGRSGSPAPAGAMASGSDASDSSESFKRWLLSDWCAAFRARFESVQCLAESKGESKLTPDSAGPFGTGQHVVMAEKLPVREDEESDSKIIAELSRLSTVTVARAHDDGRGLLSEPIEGWITRLSESGKVQLAKPDWQEQRNWNWQASDFRYPGAVGKDLEYIGSYCMDCLSMALHCVWTTCDFRSAVLKSANLCGDADTVSAVVGQIAGAIYGASAIPAAWRQQQARWDGGDLVLKAWLLYHREDASLLTRAVGRAAGTTGDGAETRGASKDDSAREPVSSRRAESSSAAGNSSSVVPGGVLLVGVAGPTRGGKGTLANELRRRFEGASVLNQDRYFKRDGETPDCIDFRRMKKDLRRMIDSAASHAFAVKATKVVIAEGFLLYADRELESWFGLRIFLRLDKDTCYHRRLATKKAGLASDKFDRYFEKTIWPAHEKHGVPQLEGAHILDGSRPPDDVASEAIELVQNALDARPFASGTGKTRRA